MSTAYIEPIGKIDINMLAALRLILSERNVGRAALEFGLSQPAMSNALARMRKAFDDPLLVRVHGRMELTSRGEELRVRLDAILPQIERLAQSEVFDPHQANICFRIVATDHAMQLIMPSVIAEVSRRSPNASMIVSTVTSREIIEEDPFEHIDLRLGWFVSPPQSWLIRKLLADDMVIAAGEQNSEVGEAIDAELFATIPQIGIRMRRDLNQTGMDKVLAQQGLSRNVKIWLSNFNAVPHILRRSNLIALVPEALARRYRDVGGIRIIMPPAPLQAFGVSMAWSPTLQNDSAHRWLRALIVECVRDLPEKVTKFE